MAEGSSPTKSGAISPASSTAAITAGPTLHRWARSAFSTNSSGRLRRFSAAHRQLKVRAVGQRPKHLVELTPGLRLRLGAGPDWRVRPTAGWGGRRDR